MGNLIVLLLLTVYMILKKIGKNWTLKGLSSRLHSFLISNLISLKKYRGAQPWYIGSTQENPLFSKKRRNVLKVRKNKKKTNSYELLSTCKGS
jgi:hypothetical protein